jgi:hypothetical protein
MFQDFRAAQKMRIFRHITNTVGRHPVAVQ